MKLTDMTNEQLTRMMEKITSDPSNRTTPGTTIYLYTPKARKKLDAIARAITSNLADKRIAAGLPLNQDGYSGRQTNRRR